MGFFYKNPERSDSSASRADNIILYAGEITERAMLDCWTQARAESISRRRHEAAELELQFPGYREELNKQRARAGLPPI